MLIIDSISEVICGRKWWLDPAGFKRRSSVTLAHSQIIVMRNGDLNRRGEATWSQLDWQYCNSHVCAHPSDRHSRGSTFRNGLWMVSDKMATELWKNSWDVSAINTFSAALHCGPCVRLLFFLFFFHLQDRWWQVIWVQAGGGVVGEERGRMVNSSVSRLCVQTGGGGGGSNVSGGTQISWPFQRFSVYFETCQRLYRENVH